jgi:NTP pyrophosphatase (non-canonical NTP hydrolase)
MKLEQFKKISDWQKKTFGHSTAASKVAHLIEEVEELNECLVSGVEGKEIEHEFADCFILLFGAAASFGMDYEYISKVIDSKMEINYKRKWGKVQPNGVVNHIKE